MDFEILGHITCKETGSPAPNLDVEAIGLSELTNREKNLGKATTNDEGYFRIVLPDEQVTGAAKDHYVIRQWGIYLMIFNQMHACVYDGKHYTDFKPISPYVVDLSLPESVLKEKGKSPQDRMAEMMKFAKSL
jgi:5-hydroxyisourate hydrolase-like protein (transthyretin family)